MVIRRVLERLAAGAAVPVFAIAGVGGREAAQDLRLEPRVRLVDTPRAATVLLVVGTLPTSLQEPLQRVHDAMPHPRATVVAAEPNEAARASAWLPQALTIEGTAQALATAVRVHGELLSGARASERAVLPDVEPAPWQGVGPYGQGGTGMTGGVPYGRPMAELGDDRDGLRLDVLPASTGPFFPRFPSGLAVRTLLAGDVIVEASVDPNPFVADGLGSTEVRSGLRPFLRALEERVPVAELELARAREHLRWLSDALVAHGLEALGTRALALAVRLRATDSDELHRLTRMVERSQVLRWSTGGVGRIEPAWLAGLGVGPVARASGLAEDARLDDAAYRALGFEPAVQAAGDASARWRQRIAEAAQALELAARAGGRLTQPSGRVEGPRGTVESGRAPSAGLLSLLPELLAGLEWGDAVATVVSLDLDLEEAAAVERAAAGVPA